MHLLNRTIYGVVGLLILALAGVTLQKHLVEPGALWLRVGMTVLLLGSVGSLWHDHRQGHFGNRRLGPASALVLVSWTLVLLAALITSGSAST